MLQLITMKDQLMVAIAATIAAGMVFFYDLCALQAKAPPQVTSALAKGDRLRPLVKGDACSGRSWPNYNQTCQFDLRKSADHVRPVRVLGLEKARAPLVAKRQRHRDDAVVGSSQALVGAFAVIAGLLFVERVAAGAFAGLTITANILMSHVIDRYGLFGMEVNDLGGGRIAGAALMAGGIVLISKFANMSAGIGLLIVSASTTDRRATRSN